MAHDLIELTKLSSMPVPFSSAEPGEAWGWGDFVLTLQARPRQVLDAMSAMVGRPKGPTLLEYPFAMSVFYRKDRNPHGPSSRPVLVATLEKGFASPTIFECLFSARGHLNFGHYDGPLTIDHARNCFFKRIASHLSLTGQAVKIGDISAVFGHPDTGWPSQSWQPDRPPAVIAEKRASGCLSVMAVLAFVALLLRGAFILFH